MKAVFRSLCLGFWLLCCTLAQATNVNGVWSVSGSNDYLLMMESTSGSAVVLRVKADLSGGAVYVGQRNQQTLVANTIDGRQMLSLEFNNNSYTGGLITDTGASPQTLAGNLMLAYAGGAYDGVWQRNGASDRYLVTLSVNLAGVNTMLVVDTRLSSGGAAVSYDVSTGAVVSGATPSYVGRSLLTGNTVSHAFKGGAPAAGFYSILTNGRPVTLVESFDTVQLLQVSTAP